MSVLCLRRAYTYGVVMFLDNRTLNKRSAVSHCSCQTQLINATLWWHILRHCYTETFVTDDSQSHLVCRPFVTRR